MLENSYLRVDLVVELGISPAIYGLERIIESFESLPKIGIHAAIAAFSITGGQFGYFCKCKSNCQKDSCKCFKAGRKCTSRCHKESTTCLNHDMQIGRGADEIPVVVDVEVEVQCGCLSSCTKKTCACFKAGKMCNIRCHRKSNLCRNKHNELRVDPLEPPMEI